MKKELLILIKEEMSKSIDEMDYSNWVETSDRMNSLFTIIETTDNLSEIKSKPSTDSIVLDLSDSTNVQIETDKNKEKESDKAETYEFERKLKGGILKDGDGFVPEKTIRDLGIQNGDKLYTKLIAHGSGNSPDRYEYSIAEKVDEPKPLDGIEELTMGIVHHDFSRDEYLISQYMSKEGIESVDINDSDDTGSLVLQERDIEAMDILDGDILDVAYYKSNPATVRVRWRHDNHQLEHHVPKKRTYYKTSSSTSSEPVEKVLEGKTILIVGGDSQWTSYREEVENLGGELMTKSGNDSIDSIETAVKKSDCVVNNIAEARHRATGAAVDFAKMYDTPHTNVENMGRTTFINSVKETIGV